jgi:RimJ/RimL family protein N-acetyltransferase
MNAVFDLQPTLAGKTITLRPVAANDFDALYAVASDPLLWEQHPEPLRYQRPVFEGFFAGALASGGALVVIDNFSHAVIGCSRYYDWNPAEREIAVGYSFLSRRYWGGATNAAMKRLMFNHAFQWAQTVWLHIGRHNKRSRRAAEKVHAVFSHEGSKVLNGITHEYAFYKIKAP